MYKVFFERSKLSGFDENLLLETSRELKCFVCGLIKRLYWSLVVCCKAFPLYSPSLQSSNTFDARTFKLVPPPPLMSLSQTHNAIANSKATVTSFHEKSTVPFSIANKLSRVFCDAISCWRWCCWCCCCLSICVSCQPMLFMARLILTLTHSYSSRS